jgi:tetratricopeptide (TPR) repeat protein
MAQVTNLSDLMEIGASLLREGSAEDGLAVYESALALEATNREALLGKVQALLQLDRPDEACRYAEYVVRHHPDDPTAQNLLGTAALTAGRGELAITAFTDFQRLAGVSADNFLNLAAASFLNLELERAREYNELALLEDPQSQEGRTWQEKLEGIKDTNTLLIEVGRTHCREGRFQQGLELFRRALDEKDSFPGRLYSGRACLGLGQAGDAVAQLKSALAIEPDNQEAMFDMATAYLLSQQPQQAEEIYNQILSRDPGDVDALMGKGQLLTDRNELEAARGFLQQAIRVAPERPDLWLLQARLLHREGKTAEARLAADHAIAGDVEAAAAWATGAEVLRSCGEEVLAFRYTEMAGQLEPDQFEAAAETPEEELKPVSAEAAELDKLLETLPGYVHAYEDRMEVYSALGEGERALHYIELILQRWPESEGEKLACQRATLLLSLQRPEEARVAFNRALEISPGSAYATQGLDTAEAMLAETREESELEAQKPATGSGN